MKKQKEKIRNWIKNYEAQILTEAESLNREEFPELTEELFSQFEKTGNRLNYENAYFERRKYLLVYALEAMIRKEQKHTVNIKKLEWVLEQMTEELCWALPAHVNRQTDPAWEITLDLFASETAQTLAEIGWIFREELDPGLKARMQENIDRRVLKPFGNSPDGFYEWEHAGNNWNAVCGCCVGAAAWYRKQVTTSEKQKQEMDILIRRVCRDLACFLKSFSEDGACLEGLGYWEYGMSYYTMFADLLKQSENEGAKLPENEKVKRIMEFQQICYFPGGRTLSFSDGDSRGKYRMGLTCYLKEQEEKVEIPDVKYALQFGEDPCYRWNAGYRDWMWTKNYLARDPVDKKGTNMPALKLEEKKGISYILPDAQWVIFNGNHQISAACKGGHNGEPHNHNDVGSFLYVIGEEEIISDLGAGEYTKDYFGEGRYEILCNSSRGHSVPVPEKTYQQAGSTYGAESFWIVDSWTVEICYGKAYGEIWSGKLKRTLHFRPERGVLQIEDRCTGIGQSTDGMIETLVTRRPVKVENDGIRIGDSGYVKISGISYEKVWTEEAEHREHDGSSQMVTLIHWAVPADRYGNCNCRFEVMKENG